MTVAPFDGLVAVGFSPTSHRHHPAHPLFTLPPGAMARRASGPFHRLL